ncbi:NUDIX domain-containing protein [Fluviibacterium sp. DFM31]|uniref:ADP-ribose pyrophosphatase n=1 Tax=Meridianimarinicoccus marinus TaxID=3231483 RepID=A0ABV3L6G0_9RHOB
MASYKVRGPLADEVLLTTVLGEGAYHLANLRDPEGWPQADLTVTTAEAQARLGYYMAAHGLDLPPEFSQVFNDYQTLAGRTFSSEVWTARWRDIWRAAAEEIMLHRTSRPPETLTPWLNNIWSRADSRLRAQAAQRVCPSGLDRDDLTVQHKSYGYFQYFAVADYVYDHAHFDGSRSEALLRGVFLASDAVTVLPYDPVRDRVLVIEQLRAAPLARGDRGLWLMEPVAGRIEPADNPEDTAIREAWEEAHVRVTGLHKIGEYYPTTGAFSEYIYAFVGLADLPDDAGKLAGLDIEGEDIRGHVMSRAELMAAVTRGDIPVGPLVISAYWLDANHHRLGAGG